MDTTDKPREIVIHQSANRPNLLLGGDRELVLVMVMIAGGLAFSLAALQRMGKADPLLRQVYLRHIRYSAFYPAKCNLHGRSAETPASWR